MPRIAARYLWNIITSSFGDEYCSQRENEAKWYIAGW